jgi:hypothetical protein
LRGASASVSIADSTFVDKNNGCVVVWLIRQAAGQERFKVVAFTFSEIVIPQYS